MFFFLPLQLDNITGILDQASRKAMCCSQIERGPYLILLLMMIAHFSLAFLPPFVEILTQP